MNAMIARRDANGDGLLQADEMASRGDRMARMFERLDANDDGSIDADEFEAAADRIGRGDGARGHGGGRYGHDRKPHG
jgi:Ca2+-binding EF-hand superfamily protein